MTNNYKNSTRQFDQTCLCLEENAAIDDPDIVFLVTFSARKFSQSNSSFCFERQSWISPSSLQDFVVWLVD